MPTRKSKPTSKPPGEGTVHLICPGCYIQYEFPEYTINEEKPICSECNLPLLRTEENREDLKCLRCMHRAVVPDGIWCRQFNRAAAAENAERCHHYAQRRRTTR
ncbi:MAG: hypothetical protein ACFFDP_02640 [Promethearchaeota archaeon]